MVLLLSEPAELQKCVLSDTLTTVSQGGQDLGNFSMTVDFGRKSQRSCMLLHAQSQGAIDGSPCGTSVTGEFRARGSTKLVHVPLHQCPHLLGTIQFTLPQTWRSWRRITMSTSKWVIARFLHDRQLFVIGMTFFFIYTTIFIIFNSWREEVWTSNVTWCNVMDRWWSAELRPLKRWKENIVMVVDWHNKLIIFCI